MAGVDPTGDYTLRELVWMSDAKEDAEWARTCYIVATVGSLFAKKAIDPADIHPMWEPKGEWTGDTLEARSERRRNQGRQGSR